MPEKIAIIGANVQQNPLIVKAKEKGYETHTFAWQDGGAVGMQTSDYFYPISAASKDEILKKCQEIGVCAVAAIGSDVSAQAAAYVAEKLGLLSNAYERVVCATNKLKTREILNNIGVLQPAYVEIGDAVPFERVGSLAYPLIVKPSDRSGARGITVIERETEFFSAINTARDLSFERKAIVEEYIAGETYSCECLSYNGEHQIIGYTKRETALIAGRPCEYKHTQPATLPISVKSFLQREVPRILTAFDLRLGVSSVEFILDKNNNVYFIEIAPYMYGDYVGTDLVPAAYGVDLTGVVLDIACGKEIAVVPKETNVQAMVAFDYCSSPTARGQAVFSTVPRKEFGGCPVLKLPNNGDYFENADTMVALNSEYTAFWYALQLLAPTRVHLPYYASSVWGKIAAELKIPCAYYYIGEDFMPMDLCVNEGEAVFFVNHFGLCGEKIKTFACEKKIIDNSMSFYCAPVWAEGTYNIYSCRKFFAVPDGAYLVSSSLAHAEKLPLEQDVSYKRAAALLKCLELGKSFAYKDSQTSEQELSSQRKSMSRLTRQLQAAVDCKAEQKARAENFALLHAALSKYNTIDAALLMETPSQYYPLLLKEDVREQLLARKIFIPLFWRNTLTKAFEGRFEQMLSKRLVCLPISSEYSRDDMQYLAQTVISLIT